MRIQVNVRMNGSNDLEWSMWETLQVESCEQAKNHCLAVLKANTHLTGCSYIII